ncbi:MAG: formyltetrahydrofolate deformylase [Flavobacteriaceae bacterium]
MQLTLLILCEDQTGIISAVTGFLHKHGGNVVYLDQHVDKQVGKFFMRIEVDFKEHPLVIEAFKASFSKELAGPYEMKWNVYAEDDTPKMAVYVSKYNHCLYDLLSRFKSGELQVDIPFVLSNHKDLEYVAKQFDVPFYWVPIDKSNKLEAEKKQIALLEKYQVDFIVLARYMQIITSQIVDRFPNKIINIHHSFLPAFAGAKPYHAAFERGVKIIGATSHYVTEELDEGPIIAQDVTTVSHAHTVADFIEKGRDLEKIVLARAVQLHCKRKTMVYNNKTVIFS